MRNAFDPISTPSLSASITAPSQQDTRAAKTLTVTPSGGSGTYTYAWTWVSRPTGAAATFSATNVANPSVTPDAEGVWAAKCIVDDGSLNVTVYTSVTVGVETAAGIYGRVLFDLDFVAIGTAATIDLLASGDADYTIGGVRFYCSTDGATVTTFAVNSNGLQAVTTTSNCSCWAFCYLVSDFGITGGDTVILQATFGASTMGLNGYVGLVVTDDKDAPITAGTDSFGIEVKRNNADGLIDLNSLHATSLVKLIDIGGTSPPADWEAAVRANNAEFSTYYDTNSTMSNIRDLTERAAESDGTFLSASRVIASGRYVTPAMTYGGVRGLVNTGYIVKRLRAILVRPEVA